MDFALRPLDFLEAHLGERAAKLVVETHESLDPGNSGIADAPIDLTREVDDLIGLPHHLVHHVLQRSEAKSPRLIASRQMGDNREAPAASVTIAGFAARCTSRVVGDER